MIEVKAPHNIRIKYHRFTITRRRLTGSWGELPERYYLGFFEFKKGYPLLKAYFLKEYEKNKENLPPHIKETLEEAGIKVLMVEDIKAFPQDSSILIIQEPSREILDAIDDYGLEVTVITTTRTVKDRLTLKGLNAFYFEEVKENLNELKLALIKNFLRKGKIMKVTLKDIEREIKNQGLINSVEINRISQHFDFKEEETLLFLTILAFLEKGESDAILLPGSIYLHAPFVIQKLEKIVPNAPEELGESGIFWKLLGATTFITTGMFHSSQNLLHKSHDREQMLISASPSLPDEKTAKNFLRRIEKKHYINYDGIVKEVSIEKGSKRIPRKIRKKPEKLSKFPELTVKLDESLERFPPVFLLINPELYEFVNEHIKPEKKKVLRMEDEFWLEREKHLPTCLSIWL